MFYLAYIFIGSALLLSVHSLIFTKLSHGSCVALYDVDRNRLDCGPCIHAPKCSGEYKSKGCDGTGKIQGGIATIGIFSWWPIKVFRPCPSYLTAGYAYKREGQTMDQVLFSEPSTKMKEKMEALRNNDSLTKSTSSLQTEINGKKAEIIESDDPAIKLLNEKFKDT